MNELCIPKKLLHTDSQISELVERASVPIVPEKRWGTERVSVDSYEINSLLFQKYDLNESSRTSYSRFTVSKRIAPLLAAIRDELSRFGCILPSSGGFRSLNAKITPGRSPRSFHYSGLAFDIFTLAGGILPGRHVPGILPGRQKERACPGGVFWKGPAQGACPGGVFRQHRTLHPSPRPHPIHTQTCPPSTKNATTITFSVKPYSHP